MLRRQVGKVLHDLSLGHPARQVLQHVVDGNAGVLETGLAAADASGMKFVCLSFAYMMLMYYDGHQACEMNGQLQILRKRKALSRRDLAKLAGTSESTIYRAESGRNALQPGTIRKLAKALGVSPEELTRDQIMLDLR